MTDETDRRHRPVAPAVRVRASGGSMSSTVRVYDDDRRARGAPRPIDAAAISRRDRRTRRAPTSCSPPATRNSRSSPRSVDAGPTSTGRASPAFHMDEYVGLAADHPASFQRYMRERVAGASAVRRRSTTSTATRAIPTPKRARYAALLAEHPLDLCCLGIGENGHLAFNDPPVADFDDPLDREGRRARRPLPAPAGGRGPLRDVADVPPQAITVTIPALLARRPRARDRARGPQGRAGARRARGPDRTDVPGVDPAPAAARDALPRSRIRRRCSRCRHDRSRDRLGGHRVPEPRRARAPPPAAPGRHRAHLPRHLAVGARAPGPRAVGRVPSGHLGSARASRSAG